MFGQHAKPHLSRQVTQVTAFCMSLSRRSQQCSSGREAQGEVSCCHCDHTLASSGLLLVLAT